MTPVRMQLSRARGFNLQQASLALNGLPALNVSRPGPLGNPFIVGEAGTRAECVDLHAKMLAGYLPLMRCAPIESQRLVITYVAENLKVLRNRNVACWCPLNAPCHGDTYLELFNRPRCRKVA